MGGKFLSSLLWFKPLEPFPHSWYSLFNITVNFFNPFHFIVVWWGGLLVYQHETWKNTKHWTTLSDGYLGSRTDEERSEMRYVMRIAEFSESSSFWTQIALSGKPWEHASLSIGSI
jgi:hypothetical protein